MLKKLLPLLIFSIAQSKEPNPFERLAVDQKLTAVQTTLNSVNSKLCTAGGSKNLKPLIQSLMEQDTELKSLHARLEKTAFYEFRKIQLSNLSELLNSLKNRLLSSMQDDDDFERV